MQNTTIVVYGLTYLCYFRNEKFAVPLQREIKEERNIEERNIEERGERREE